MEACKVQGVGVDISDRSCQVTVLDSEGNELECTKVACTEKSVSRYFSRLDPSRVAMEVGTHSPWISRVIEELGHEVYVANARKLRAIWDTEFKCDRTDSRLLAEIVLFKPTLLRPIKHRGDAARQDLALIRTRAVILEARTRFVNHVRGTVKAFGGRMPSCDADSFHKLVDEIPEVLRDVLEPVMSLMEVASAWVRGYDEHIAKNLEDKPEASRLLQVPNIGPVTTLAFLSTIETPNRFPKLRNVASYLGLVPRRDQSGDQDRQLRITKAGDNYVRALLVQCAHRTLVAHSADSDLKRWGLALAERGGKNGKRRAVVAVARKLSILLLSLWRSGKKYRPFRAETSRKGAVAVAPPSSSSPPTARNSKRARVRNPVTAAA